MIHIRQVISICVVLQLFSACRGNAKHESRKAAALPEISAVSDRLLKDRVGRSVNVFGHLCSFEKKSDSIIMIMGNDDWKPLLTVIVKRKAVERAEKDHQQYMRIDSMVKSPLGDTFTAVGTLKIILGKPTVQITDPKHIIIGKVIREDDAEK